MKMNLKTTLVVAGAAALLSVPMAFALNWAINEVDHHWFSCPWDASYCTLYPLGMGNGQPALNLAPGQRVDSMLVSRMIVYPPTTTTTTTTES